MIDSKLQADLRAYFNPDGSNLRKMQLRLLEMLKYIDKICRENNIKYWLSSGTCLGAVRHGGFIPWDDDVDIEMLREDYTKLCKVLKKNINPNYFFQQHPDDPEYLLPYAKLRDLNSTVKEKLTSDRWSKYKGCSIDIFVIESSNSKILWKIGNVLWNHLILSSYKVRNGKLRKTKIFFGRLLLEKLIFKTFRLFTQKTNNTIFRHSLGSGFLKVRHLPDFSDQKWVPFEDTILPIPVNSDNYLRELYGDYFIVPSNKHFHLSNLEGVEIR